MKLQKKQHFRYKKNLRLNKHLLRFGTFGFKVVLQKRILKKQEDNFKLFILRYLKTLSNKKIKYWFFSNCLFNQTKLPLESRMGKGKGEIVDKFGFYNTGFILLEIKGITFLEAITLKKKLIGKNIIKLKLVY